MSFGNNMKNVLLFIVRLLGIIMGLVFGLSGIISSIMGFFGFGSASTLLPLQQISRFGYYLLLTISLVMPYRKILNRFHSAIILFPIIILNLVTMANGLPVIIDSYNNLSELINLATITMLIIM